MYIGAIFSTLAAVSAIRPWATVLLSFVVLATAACGGAPGASERIEGRLVAVGGGGAIDQMNALAKKFAELHPAVRFDVQNLGSDGGYSLVASGSADLGFASRDPSDLEREKNGILEIGASGTGVAVNANNPVSSLTKDQLRDLYGGKVTSWSQFRGDNVAVKLFVREPNSATRLSFDSFIFGNPNAAAVYPPETVTAFSNDEMILGVRSFAGGAGMVTVKAEVLKAPGVKLLALDGVAATPENVRNGSYRFRRAVFLTYPKDLAKAKPSVRAFVDFVRSPDGQKVLEGF